MIPISVLMIRAPGAPSPPVSSVRPCVAAAAEARAVLVEMASEKLGVPVAQLEVKDGIVADTGDPSKSVSYAELAKGKKLEKYLDVKPPVEDYTKLHLCRQAA
ncbi:MAG: hypothetical protein MZV63_01370 [Marinilabiliales bacterium]|nr:hypothetical protein [Marinilabiliales bacterium]